MKKLALLFVCYLLIFGCKVGRAYFPDLGVGARPTGMGGAYTGVADDANAPLWNTAGLVQLSKRQLTAMSARLYSGLNLQLYTGETDRLGYHFLSFAQPLRRNVDVLAASCLRFNSAFYDEMTCTLSYARSLHRMARQSSGEAKAHASPLLSAGINLKILHLSISANDYTTGLSSLSKTDATLDFSLFYQSVRRLRLGLTVENVRPANLGVVEDEEAPVKFALGLAYQEGNTSQLMTVTYRRGQLNSHKDVSLRLGIEHWLFNRHIGMRAGYNLRAMTTGASSRYARQKYEFQLDYAFIYPLASIVNSLGSHRFALSAKF